MFNKVPILKNGNVAKFADGIVFAVNDKPNKTYSKALSLVLLNNAKDDPYVQGDLERAYWAPIRDYRFEYVSNRVPPTEDIFGYCSKDGKVQINEMHQFKTNLGFPQLSPFLHKHLIARMKALDASQ